MKLVSVLFAAISIVAGVAPRLAVSNEPVGRPLQQAHAHNDYLHERPLADALSHGFASVEADIFLVDGKLLVAHEKRDIKPERTLEALYLDPLQRLVRKNGGSVYPGGGAFHLLIDLKSAGEPTYAALSKVLARYADMITSTRDGKLEPKAVNVVVSGNRPRKLMEGETVRYAGYDGRLGDLDSDVSADFMPLVSDNWAVAFKWKGQGTMPEVERAKLVDAVNKAHAHGRRIRFWATPESIDAWRVLQAAGVDMINTDDLAGLEKFLRGQGAVN